MFKIVNEDKESKEILKWSKKFVDDILNDPEIKELSKLPDNEYGEKAVDVSVEKGRFGETVIGFGSWGSAGEVSIAGFDKNGKPYFDSVDGYGKDSYEKVLREIKKSIKDDIKFTQKYNKEREENRIRAEKEFSKLSQEEKDKIVMDYLINKK